jgi:hypothetical protein
MGIYQTLDTAAGWFGISLLFVFALVSVLFGFFDRTTNSLGRIGVVLGGIGMIVGGVLAAIALSKLS